MIRKQTPDLQDLHNLFQTIPKIRKPQEYLESAIKVAKQKSEQARNKVRKDELVQTKTAAYVYVQMLTKMIEIEMQQTIKRFPPLDRLPPFYKELVAAMMDRAALKHSLGAIQFCGEQMKRFEREYLPKVKKQQKIQYIINIRKELLGRVASVLKNITKELEYAEHCRRLIKGFPIMREDCFTTCIFGFPNVGKTTLLSRLTSSKPEIASYAFTTKTLNIGYLKIDGSAVQFIDTPGTLNRFDQMNGIEQQAWIALERLADIIVYVFDLTEPYPLRDQEELYKRVKKLKKPVFCYLSKTDIVEPIIIEKFKKQNVVYGVKGLIVAIKEVLSRKNFK